MQIVGLFAYHPEITVRTAYDLKPYTAVSKDEAKMGHKKERDETYVYDNLYDSHAV